jgi:hypothetical protein
MILPLSDSGEASRDEILVRSGERRALGSCSLTSGGCECPDPFSSRPAISENVIAAYRQRDALGIYIVRSTLVNDRLRAKLATSD